MSARAAIPGERVFARQYGSPDRKAVNPCGRKPIEAKKLDDQVLDLHLSAAAQVDNTDDMLVVFAQIFRDGRVDDEDEHEVRTLLARTKVEHRMNLDQETGMSELRKLVAPFLLLVDRLRARLQLAGREVV